MIPRWLETTTRPAILDSGITTLEAIAGDGGSLSLELLTPAPGLPAPLRPGCASDVALLLRSSGTTGAPKLIPVTHGNLLAMAQRLGSDLWHHLTAQDRAACILPLYYAAGLKTSLFVPLLLGASVAFPDPARGQLAQSGRCRRHRTDHDFGRDCHAGLSRDRRLRRP